MDGSTCAVGDRARGTARKLLVRPQESAAPQEAKGRDGLLHSHGPRAGPIYQAAQALGLIIPRARDRWFKSNPRNQFGFSRPGPGVRPFYFPDYFARLRQGITGSNPTLATNRARTPGRWRARSIS